MFLFCAGLKPVKVVYIDPPVPKKEMTVREKNQVFHEFLTEYHMTKQSTVFAHGVVLDKPSEKPVSYTFTRGGGSTFSQA